MSKKTIYFAHANGFPAKTYSKLFSYLEDDFEIEFLERHAHNPKFPVADGWQRLRDELREQLNKRGGQKVIGIGHSLGGILHLLTAAENLELYQAIVLLDAPIISRLSSAGLKLMKKTNLLEKIPLARTTRFRRSFWKTKEEAFEHFLQKEKFADFDREVLRDYVEYGTIETETGVKLFFEPKIEAMIYQTLPDNLPKLRKKLKVPVAYIGGTNSREARLARLDFMRNNFDFKFRFLEGSHLFPLEKPKETAEIIKEVLQSLLD